MCGIVGIFNMKNAENVTFSEKDKAFLIKFLLTELTIETESRGKDATGYAALFENGESIGLKHGIKAEEFCTKGWEKEQFSFKNHTALIETYHNEVSPVASVISHCRAKTVGPETDNDNNHPIYVGNMIGIHNGCLSNHSTIYDKIKGDIERVGMVDSEMIVQLLWLATDKGEKKFDNSMIKYVTEKLDGSFAYIGLDKKNPDSVFFLRDTRPIEFVYIKSAGLLVVVSEKRFFDSVSRRYNWLNYYDFSLPNLETETYTLPDDVGFVLDLNTKIEKETKIKEFISETVKIERTGVNWKSANSPIYGNYYQQGNVATYSPNNTDDEDTYGCMRKEFPKDSKQLEAVGEAEKKKIKEKTEVKFKKIEKTEEKTSKKRVSASDFVKITTWNKTKNEFENRYKPTKQVYVNKTDTLASKYTIFKGTKQLAIKLGLSELVLGSYSCAQIANRVSKMVYTESSDAIETGAKKINKLEKEIETLKRKAERARQHIITLRGIANTFVRLWNTNHADGEKELKLGLDKFETGYMKNLWKFLYSSNRDTLKTTKIGKFIYDLGIGTNTKKESGGKLPTLTGENSGTTTGKNN